MTKIPISKNNDSNRWKYLVECDFHNTDVIRMLRAQAKREGNDELRKELDRLLPLSLAKDEKYKKEKEIENKKLWDKQQKDLEERKQKKKKEDVEEQLKLLEQVMKQNKDKEEKALEYLKKINWDLYYITHIDNLPSLLERGILSPVNVLKLGLKPTLIWDEKINDRRDKYIQTSEYEQLKLEDYTHVFFNPINAMQYNVTEKYGTTKIVIIGVILNVSYSGTYITDRNAAHSGVQCWGSSECHESIPRIQKDTLPIWRDYDKSVFWQNDGSKGKVMAECLVQDKISSVDFKSIYVLNVNMIEKIRQLLPEASKIEIKMINTLA